MDFGKKILTIFSPSNLLLASETEFLFAQKKIYFFSTGKVTLVETTKFKIYSEKVRSGIVSSIFSNLF